MTKYPFEDEFDWFLPTSPKTVLTITISDEKSINLNRRLCESMPSNLRIEIKTELDLNY